MGSSGSGQGRRIVARGRLRFRGRVRLNGGASCPARPAPSGPPWPRSPAAPAARARPERPGARYRATAGRILGRAFVNEGAWTKLEYLTTRFGHRLSGSPSLEKAVACGPREYEGRGAGRRPAAGREGAPARVRGREWARVVSPVERELPSGPGHERRTPSEGLTAPVVVVRSFEELTALGREKVEGKIVAFAPDWEGYGRTVRFRSSGASAAASGAGCSCARPPAARWPLPILEPSTTSRARRRSRRPRSPSRTPSGCAAWPRPGRP